VDPGYAAAYVGLAECYGLLPNYTNLHSGEADKKAIAAATKALEIDSNLAEAYATLASADPNRWDGLEAERQFRRAIQLNPSYAYGTSMVRRLPAADGAPGSSLPQNTGKLMSWTRCHFQ